MIPKKAVPMIHVPDVLSTVDWYKSIGFTVDNTFGNDSEGLSFAILSFGNSQVMFNEGGSISTSKRREVDLYVYTEGVDQLFEQLKERVDVVEGPHDTFYGMREFIFRDLNRFWITFGQASVFVRLMNSVRDDNVEAAQTILEHEKLKSETLTSALAASKSTEMERVLKSVGAIPPAKVAGDRLKTYAGTYKKDDFQVTVIFADDALFAAPGRQEPLRLLALTETTFTPMYLDDFGQITFNVVNGEVNTCTLSGPSYAVQLQRTSE